MPCWRCRPTSLRCSSTTPWPTTTWNTSAAAGPIIVSALPCSCAPYGTRGDCLPQGRSSRTRCCVSWPRRQAHAIAFGQYPQRALVLDVQIAFHQIAHNHAVRHEQFGCKSIGCRLMVWRTLSRTMALARIWLCASPVELRFLCPRNAVNALVHPSGMNLNHSRNKRLQLLKAVPVRGHDDNRHRKIVQALLVLKTLAHRYKSIDAVINRNAQQFAVSAPSPSSVPCGHRMNREKVTQVVSALIHPAAASCISPATIAFARSSNATA